MPAIWFALPLCVLAVFYVTLLMPSDGYSVDATAKATATLPFIGAFCAGCAAWEGSRLRRARLWATPLVRTRVEVVGWGIAPVVVAGFIALGAAVVAQLLRSNAGMPDGRIILVAVADLVAYSVAAFAAGLLLPLAVAIPLSIVGALAWLAFVPAVDPVWLRHLTGMFRDCCAISADLAPAAVASSIAMHVGIVGAVVVFIGTELEARRRWAAAAATLVGSVAVAVLPIAGMTFAPTVPREPTALECDSLREIEVCIWPEHAASSADIGAVAAEVHRRWTAAGVDVPSVFTEADPAVAPEDALVFAFHSSRSTRDDVIEAFATALLPPFPECPGGAAGGIAFEYLEAWYASVGGMSAAGHELRYTIPVDPLPPISAVIEDLTQSPISVRRDWIARASDISQACEDWDGESIAVNQ